MSQGKHSTDYVSKHMSTGANVTETEEPLPEVGTWSPDQGPEYQKPKKSKLWIIPVVIAGLAAAAYGGGVAYFSSNFMPNTTLDGTDVSLTSKAEVASQLEASLDGYATTITGEGLNITATASDLGLSYDGDAYADAAMSEINAWAWPIELAGTRNLTVGAKVKFDSSKLSSLVQPAIDQSAQAGAGLDNHGISYDAEQGAYVLADGIITQYIDMDALTDKLESELASLPSTVEVGEECLSQDAAILTALSTANSYVASAPALTLNGTDAGSVAADSVAGWISVSDDLSVSLNEDAITGWCESELSEKYDTVGTTRTYTRPDGQVKSVTGGIYGWEIDTSGAATAIIDAIKSGTKQTVDIPCTSTAENVTKGGQDWGSRYIDVDITAQHAVFWENGSIIWEADVVTGQPSKGYDTPQGVWSLTSNESGDINLRGPVDENGEPEWDSHVQFWLGVVGSSVGFHNAPWRTSFGGSIYTWYGSHGCINLSYEKAEALHNIAKVGDVVVVHS
jgi:hypothetical protein